MKHAKANFFERVKYKFDSTLSRGSLSLIFWLFVFSVAVITAVGYLVVAFGIAPSENALGASVWSVMNLALDTGTIGGAGGGRAYLAIGLMMTIFGVVIFSILIGLITTTLERRISMLLRGRSRAVESNHTVILGWSQKVIPIIREIIAAHGKQSGVIVVLGDEDKVKMEEEISGRITDLNRVKIVCRRGASGDLESVRLTNINYAKSIIIVGQDGENSDIDVIKNIISIINNPSRRSDSYNIVAEIKQPQNVEMAKYIGGREVTVVSSNDLIAMLIAQTSQHSGLPMIYSELTSFDGMDIYTTSPAHHVSLFGTTFSEIYQAHMRTTVIGYILDEEDKVLLAPEPGKVFENGMSLIVIASSKEGIFRHRKSLSQSIDGSRFSKLSSFRQKAERVLILGWNEKLPGIVKSLGYTFEERGSISVFSLTRIPKNIVKAMNSEFSEKFTISIDVVDITDWYELRDISPQSYDRIIILCEKLTLSGGQRDAQSLMTLLHVRNILSINNVFIPIIAEMHEMQNKDLAEISEVNDFIVSDHITSRILAQFSETPKVKKVLSELIDLKGNNIAIYPLSDFIIGYDPVSIQEIAASALERGKVLIGCQTISLVRDKSSNYGISLNPEKSKIIDDIQDTNVIVIHHSNLRRSDGIDCSAA